MLPESPEYNSVFSSFAGFFHASPDEIALGFGVSHNSSGVISDNGFANSVIPNTPKDKIPQCRTRPFQAKKFRLRSRQRLTRSRSAASGTQRAAGNRALQIPRPVEINYCEKRHTVIKCSLSTGHYFFSFFRASWASLFPWSAALRYHFSASARSLLTPSPF